RPRKGAIKMPKKLISTGFLLFFLLLLMETSSAATAHLKAVRIEDGSNGTLFENAWLEKMTAYDFSFNEGLKLRLLAGFDQQRLYFGFHVMDSFLTFQDDFSLDFRGSDHLRLS